MSLEAQYTDTYGGELNYTWVKQMIIEDTLEDGKVLTMRQIIKLIREQFGIPTTIKLIKQIDSGDYWVYRLQGMNRAITITCIY